MLAVVTGSNRGIGLGLIQRLKEKGYLVIALCRNTSGELKHTGVEIIENVDITDPKSLDRACQKLKGKKIDLLINNAGVFVKDGDSSNDPEHIDPDAIRKNFEVNAMGSLNATLAFLPLMNEPSKIIFISSVSGSIGRDDPSEKNLGYKTSKTALNMLGFNLALRLKKRKISVGLIHPGYTRTDMTGHKGHITVEESSQGIMQRIEELNLQNSGQFKDFSGKTIPW